MNEDTSTFTLGMPDSLGGGQSRPWVPALTIACHPVANRVGTMAPLTDLLESDTAPLSREQPIFFAPGSNAGRSVDHRGMSRDPLLVIASDGKTWELRRGTADKFDIELDGIPFNGPRRLTVEDLKKGLILTVARQFVFILHGVYFPITRSPALGLLGGGDSIEEVRRLIAKVAGLDTAVLIRGESGTGKELVAQALHEMGARRAKEFVAVNMSGIRPERATAELFGYEKGSFTGAAESHPGYFRSAHGGTLFLDEVGLIPQEVQPVLLRVLDDQKIQPLGAAKPRTVDVRLVAATDARLEEAVRSGHFEPALYHRLNSAIQIGLPPLRERREDIGLLFFTFLRQKLAQLGAVHRLDEPPAKTPHWLTARTVATICASPWPGNVRSLKGLAEGLAVRAADGASFDASQFVEAYLQKLLTLLTPSPLPEASPAVAARPRVGNISNDQILSAFDQAGWNITQAAKFLGIDKSTLSRRLAKEPSIQLLTKVTLAELLRRKAACGGDANVLAEQLAVEPALLARRLRAASE